MCGIAGFSHTTDITRRMTPYLLWEMEERGRDSWGATNGFDTIKHIGPVTHSFEKSREPIAAWDRAIFHTRGASTGHITIENQHPFTFSNAPEGSPEWRRTVTGIHNGIVANHESLNTKYNRTFTCDSMHIYKHLADGLEMKEIRGWGNLAWYDFTPDHPEGILRLLRFNQDALEIAKLRTGEIVFCSTAAPITKAARMAGGEVEFFFKTQSETIYTIDWDGAKPVLYGSKKKLTFGARYFPTEGHDHRSHNVGCVTSWDSNRSRSYTTPNPTARKQYEEGMCIRMGCTHMVAGGSRKDAVLCEECFKFAVQEALTTFKNTTVVTIS